MSVAVVSTHFDDAVLSLWSVVEGAEDVDVVTVFTAGPEPGLVADWDEDTGVDSATRMLQRAAENRAALALAGRRAVDLGLREGIYGGGVVDADLLRSALDGVDTVYVPAAIGVEHVNREHALVRDACLRIRRDAVQFADQPYCLFRADGALPDELAPNRERTVVELSQAQRERKTEAIRCYAGELDKLERAFGPFTEPHQVPYELTWTLNRSRPR